MQGKSHSPRTAAMEALLVELRLEPRRFPARESFMPLVQRIANLGRLDCIELALAPGGGGRLGFLMYGVPNLEEMRARLATLVGADSIVRCKPQAV
ncbi:MAG TPA: hypothetical protein VH301_15360 [Usitatibacter sp.]|jgi:hypothetical protein|nr:hypothetical protein [Usitatibacter sp.]